MYNDNIGVIEGGRLPLTVVRQDPEATSATLILKHQTSGAKISVTGVYDANGIADVSLSALNTATIGVYDYQINENFAVGGSDKYPNPDKCTGEFKYPTITIHDSLDEV